MMVRLSLSIMDQRNTVLEVVSETLNVPRAEVREDSKLIDLAKDSIALFELLIRLESTFGQRVKYKDISHIETVGDIIAYINNLPTKLTT
jgi:acyl carrier protein